MFIKTGFKLTAVILCVIFYNAIAASWIEMCLGMRHERLINKQFAKT